MRVPYIPLMGGVKMKMSVGTSVSGRWGAVAYEGQTIPWDSFPQFRTDGDLLDVDLGYQQYKLTIKFYIRLASGFWLGLGGRFDEDVEPHIWRTGKILILHADKKTFASGFSLKPYVGSEGYRDPIDIGFNVTVNYDPDEQNFSERPYGCIHESQLESAIRYGDVRNWFNCSLIKNDRCRIAGCDGSPWFRSDIDNAKKEAVNWGLMEILFNVKKPPSWKPNDPIPPPPTLDPSNPPEQGGESEEGGGDGDFKPEGEPVPIPPLPPYGGSEDTGFIKLFCPTQSQVNSLASFMWSTDFVDSFKKMFANPMEAIISLSLLPCTPPLGGSEEIRLGLIGSGVTTNTVNNQYMTLECGSIDIKKYWGSALDFSPFTKISIYLPYIGTHVINADDCMGTTLSVTYRIDVLTGSCVALIKCGGSVLYTFSGSCLSQIPVTGGNFTQILTSSIQLIGAGVAFGVTGGLSAPISGAIATTGAMSTVNNVMSTKTHVERSGSIGNTCGVLSIQKPYIIVERPNQSLAKGYNKYVGYPSNITCKLADLKGYTEVEKIQICTTRATSTEIEEIITLLKGGVIF